MREALWDVMSRQAEWTQADARAGTLQRLRDIGVRLFLDDFGTGYSSLSYLQRFPINAIKIDRSFVADLPNDLDACAVVSAVLGLGHGMGLVVVAEGVETREQLAALRGMGCDYAQGYFYCGPLEAEEAFQVLKNADRSLPTPTARMCPCP